AASALSVSPSMQVEAADTYHRSANSGGDANNSATANVCNGTNESVVVNPLSPAFSTNAGGPFTLGVNGNDLTDSATLSGGTAGISGTITFKLFSDANCTVQVGSDVTDRKSTRLNSSHVETSYAVVC